MSKLVETVTDTAKELGNKASEQIGKSIENARSAAGDALNQAKELGGATLQAAEQKACEMTGTVSEGLKATARTIRQSGPQEGQMGVANSAIAQTFSNSANYLDNKGFEGILSDLGTVIGKNPVAAVIVGVGLGFLLGQTSKRS